MSRTVKLLIAALVVAALAATVAACGGDDASDEDPTELLQRTFGEGASVDSGVLEITLDASAAGSDGGSLQGSLTGPFESTGEDELPLVELDLQLEVEGGSQQQSFDFGIVNTGDAGFVRVEGEDYEVGGADYETFKDVYAQSAQAQSEGDDDGSALLGQLGIDPTEWLSDVTNEGTEEIGGAETVHISGTADVAQIVTDAQRLAEQGGDAAGVNPGDIGLLEEAVTNATVDVYTGAEDAILRRLELALELDDPESDDTVTLELVIGLSDVNSAQDFEAPEDAKPIEELLPGGLSGFGGAVAPGGGEGQGGSGGQGGGLGGPTDEYLACLDEAGNDADAINDCAGLL